MLLVSVKPLLKFVYAFSLPKNFNIVSIAIGWYAAYSPAVLYIMFENTCPMGDKFLGDNWQYIIVKFKIIMVNDKNNNAKISWL